MEIPHHLLNRVIDCECGRTHQVPIHKIVVEDSILGELESFLRERGFCEVLMVDDVNTEIAFGQTAHQHLLQAGFSVKQITFPQTHDLLPDESAVEQVSRALRSKAVDIVLAVGSGVINDIVRYVTHQHHLPYISVPTAPSVDGYASSVAAMQFAGVKVTSSAHAPLAIFADVGVLCNAPWALIQAGFGDLIGKVISLSDWKLTHYLYQESICQTCYHIVFEPLNYVMGHAKELRSRDKGAVRQLFIGLINSGISIAMMGNSRPASGSEHHCSHYWDLAAFQGRRQHASHGLQVGYATHFMSRIYRELSTLEAIREPAAPDVTDAFIEYAEEFYGEGAREVIAALREKVNFIERHRMDLSVVNVTSMLESLQPEFGMLRNVEEALLQIGIPNDVGFIGIDKNLLRETFEHARELRARYTIFEFLAGQRLLQEVSGRVVQ